MKLCGVGKYAKNASAVKGTDLVVQMNYPFHHFPNFFKEYFNYSAAMCFVFKDFTFNGLLFLTINRMSE